MILDPSSVKLYISPSRIKDKPDYGAGDLVGINRATNSQGYDGNRAVDTHFPASCPPELFEGSARHEHDDDRSDLGSELEAERSRHGVVVIHGASLNEQGSFAVLAPKIQNQL